MGICCQSTCKNSGKEGRTDHQPKQEPFEQMYGIIFFTQWLDINHIQIYALVDNKQEVTRQCLELLKSVLVKQNQ